MQHAKLLVPAFVLASCVWVGSIRAEEGNSDRAFPDAGEPTTLDQLGQIFQTLTNH